MLATQPGAVPVPWRYSGLPAALTTGARTEAMASEANITTKTPTTTQPSQRLRAFARWTGGWVRGFAGGAHRGAGRRRASSHRRSSTSRRRCLTSSVTRPVFGVEPGALVLADQALERRPALEG